jgi:hypothetical protein
MVLEDEKSFNKAGQEPPPEAQNKKGNSPDASPFGEHQFEPRAGQIPRHGRAAWFPNP